MTKHNAIAIGFFITIGCEQNYFKPVFRFNQQKFPKISVNQKDYVKKSKNKKTGTEPVF
jgi:hypothetical protein